MWKRLIGIGVASVALVFGAVACGDDGDSGGGDAEVDQELVDTLMSEGATREEAECFIGALGDDAELMIGADEPEDQETADRLLEAVTECTEGEGG